MQPSAHQYIVTYDVETPYQNDVKANLMKANFFEFIDVAGVNIRLPNTTVMHFSQSVGDAERKFLEVGTAGIPGGRLAIRRYVVVKLDGYTASGPKL